MRLDKSPSKLYRDLSRLDAAALVAIAAVAIFTRFARIGAWPFEGDEFFSLLDVQSIETGGKSGPGTGLQGMIPLAYGLNFLGRALFGMDEAGSRVMSALFGVATVVVVFVGIRHLLGLIPAVATALLIALWPDHIFQSQQLRHYAFTMFFIAVALLWGARIPTGESLRDAVIACTALLLAFLCHTVSGPMFGIVSGAVLAGYLVQGRRPSRDVLIVFGVTAVLYVSLFAFVIRPASHRFAELTAGYEPLSSGPLQHNVASLVSLLGWPIALLAALGFVMAARERSAAAVYWVVAAVGLAAATIALPLVVPFHGNYAMLYALPALVLAGLAIARLAEGASGGSLAFGLSIAVALAAANLNATVSYYVDGNRPDGRAGSLFVAQNWKQGDQVISGNMGSLGFYRSELQPAIPMPWGGASTPEFRAILERAPRSWIMYFPGGAGENDPGLAWLIANSSLRLQIMKQRFDHRRRTVLVFLYEKGTS